MTAQGFCSAGTVQSHLARLEHQGFVRRCRSAKPALQFVPPRSGGLTVPFRRRVAFGRRIEAIVTAERVDRPIWAEAQTHLEIEETAIAVLGLR